MADTFIPDTKRSALPIWSLALGIVGIVLGIYLGFLASVAAVICGHKALSRLKKDGGRSTGKGMAWTGLILGYAMILWLVIFVVTIFIGFSKR